MRASELCVRNVITAWENESVVEAARRMAMFHVSDLIVVEERSHGMPRPIGMVTDRDLVVRTLAQMKANLTAACRAPAAEQEKNYG